MVQLEDLISYFPRLDVPSSFFRLMNRLKPSMIPVFIVPEDFERFLIKKFFILGLRWKNTVSDWREQNFFFLLLARVKPQF